MSPAISMHIDCKRDPWLERAGGRFVYTNCRTLYTKLNENSVTPFTKEWQRAEHIVGVCDLPWVTSS